MNLIKFIFDSSIMFLLHSILITQNYYIITIVHYN